MIFPVAAYTTGQGESLDTFYKSTSVCQRDFSTNVTLIENSTLPDVDLSILFVYIFIICIRSYDIGHSFHPIFMKFTWLVRVYSSIGPIEPQIREEMCPQNQFFGFKSNSMGVFEKKTSKLYLVPHLPKKKRLYLFLSSDPPFPQKW